MNENQLSKIIVDICYHIHVKLGPGLLESVYEEILAYELYQRGLSFSRQQDIPVTWKGMKMNRGFRADIIVEDTVLIELKSVEALAPVHYKQVITYLKLTDIKLGLLINFNQELIKTGVRRLVNGLC